MLWDPHIAPLPVVRRSAPIGDGLLRALARLRQAVAELDGTDSERDSAAFDRAAGELVTVARHTVGKAGPVLACPDLLAEVFQTAIADLEDLPEWCGPCEESDHGLCMDHAANQTTAQRYAALLSTLTGIDQRAVPATDPTEVSHR